MSSSPLSQPIDQAPAALWHALGRLGFLAQSGLVAGVVLLVWVLIAPVGYALAGSSGLVAAGVAAGVSLAAAQLALTVGQLFRGPAAPMYGMVAGMFARMSVALAVGVALQRGVPALADAAMIFYLLVFYLATLAIETVLLLAKIRPSTVRRGARLPKAV